jgi:hypothetical protein
MQQRFSVEVPLLLDRVQVTHCSLLQAHERLGAALVLFACEALIQPRHCKQAVKVVRTMHELAASLHAYVLTQDCPASLTASLRLRLLLLKRDTEKAAMQLVLVQFYCRRHTAIARWLHQQACAYLDTVMERSGETLRELACFTTQGRRDQQQVSVEGADSVTAESAPRERQQ